MNAAPSGASPFVLTPTRVGGHIGVGLPLLDLDTGRHNFAQAFAADFVIVTIPVGVTVKLNDWLAFDFESILSNELHPGSSTALTVDPGLLAVFGPVLVGARVAVTTSAPGNIGGILLVNKPFAITSSLNFFVEVDFPATVVHDDGLHIGVGLHTGVAF